MHDLERAVSRRILLRLGLALVLLAAVVLAGRDFLMSLYLENQLTTAGWIVNGAILTLFLLGLLRIAQLLVRYAREEAALRRYVRHCEDGSGDPLHGIAGDTLIARRHDAVATLRDRCAPVNHAALAAATVASESTRLSFPRFVNNVLILLGVLGTIISLSIALLGASHLVNFSDNALNGDMGLVIHGMSTAMSTTITAIVCYLFYGYFHLKLNDAQSHLLAGLEQVTALYLVPEDESSLMARVSELVRTLQETAAGMARTQHLQQEAGERLAALLETPGVRLEQELAEIRTILREGFRLPEDGAGR